MIRPHTDTHQDAQALRQLYYPYIPRLETALSLELPQILSSQLKVNGIRRKSELACLPNTFPLTNTHTHTPPPHSKHSQRKRHSFLHMTGQWSQGGRIWTSIPLVEQHHNQNQPNSSKIQDCPSYGVGHTAILGLGEYKGDEREREKKIE